VRPSHSSCALRTLRTLGAPFGRSGRLLGPSSNEGVTENIAHPCRLVAHAPVGEKMALDYRALGPPQPHSADLKSRRRAGCDSATSTPAARNGAFTLQKAPILAILGALFCRFSPCFSSTFLRAALKGRESTYQSAWDAAGDEKLGLVGPNASASIVPFCCATWPWQPLAGDAIEPRWRRHHKAWGVNPTGLTPKSK
jgi:hypothetical protein